MLNDREYIEGKIISSLESIIGLNQVNEFKQKNPEIIRAFKKALWEVANETVVRDNHREKLQKHLDEINNARIHYRNALLNIVKSSKQIHLLKTKSKLLVRRLSLGEKNSMVLDYTIEEISKKILKQNGGLK